MMPPTAAPTRIAETTRKGGTAMVRRITIGTSTLPSMTWMTT